MNASSINLKNEILKAPPKTLADHLVCFKALQERYQAALSDKPVEKIAFLSSFTTKGFKETLAVQCMKSGIVPDLYVGDYNQYAQEILNSSSGLYTFNPKITLLFIDLQTLLGEKYFHPYAADSDHPGWVDETLAQLLLFVHALKDNSNTQILIHDFEVPFYSPLGILENKQAFGWAEAVQTLNSKLRETFKRDPRVFLFNYDGFCSGIGKTRLADPKMYFMGDIRLDMNHFPALASAYIPYLKPLAGLNKKCLVLDLDNTLWGGILGEEGAEGIHLGPTPQGRSFWEFQHHLLALFERGVILAINSRNNPEEALAVIRKHPNMVLREKHFASIQINWNDKATNLKTIAEEINIGLDSLVFFDDDKINRELVKSTLPEVEVVEVPEDPTLYVQTLQQIDSFNTLHLTEEDQTRGASYAAERQREVSKKELKIEDYLKSLQTVLTVCPADAMTLPRIAQLTQKTNQFNMTTRRYLESDIQRFSGNSRYGLWGFRVQDKFGDSGLIAVVIVEKNGAEWKIDSFLMSCRVLGRKIEDSILVFLCDQARRAGAKKLIGEYIPTEKNMPAKDFYKTHAFKSLTPQLWELEVPARTAFPEEIKIEGIK